MADTRKYLDYGGLQTYDAAIKKYIGDKIGSYDVAGEASSLKNYIDSRIFVGTAAEVDIAKEAKKIDETTLCVVTDEDAEEFTSVTSAEIIGMF